FFEAGRCHGDLADRVMKILERKAKGKIRFPRALAYAIAKRIRLREQRKRLAETESDIDFQAERKVNDDFNYRMEQSRLRCLDECVKELSPRDHQIFVGYN